MACSHENFSIDRAVDEEVRKCFDQMVQLEIEKLGKMTMLDPEMRRRVAIGRVLERKEAYKLAKKQYAAKKKEKTLVTKIEKQKMKSKRKQKRKTKTLLQKCLINSFLEERRRAKQIGFE
ncbi:hypothetical protein TcasGA2_TC016109 [Tribolium castaneum]|uniref:Uncharacterized protein n=1 Tax=Tribolium castaneum TaxID=7070 RepID=D7EIS7_TRICA|nr:hypothetical protein TcasGA2_TC016109 [Tribolium castaneum]